MANESVATAVAAAQAVTDNAQRLGLTWSLRPATVIAGVDPNDITARYDGDTAPLKMISLIGSLPVGARVYGAIVPPSGNYIVGMYGQDLVALPNSASLNLDFVLGTKADTAFSDTPSPSSLAFEKRSNTSRLLVHVCVEFFADTVPTKAEFGLNINGTDYAVVRRWVSQANDVVSKSGVRHLINIPAGSHVAQLRWRRTGGASTLTVSAAEQFSFSITETD